MTQTKEKNKPEDLEADGSTPKKSPEELENEKFVGVHVLGEEDMAKHFRPRDKDSDGDRVNERVRVSRDG